jgi:superfamily II DNA or RNA helicase
MNPFTERYYQAEALVISASAFLHDRVYRQVIGLPTGTGKTVILANLLSGPHRAWLNRFPKLARRILVLAHRDELLEQAAEKIGQVNPGLHIDIEAADRRASPSADVVVASVQTLTACGGRRLATIDPRTVRVVAIDECHHAPAPSYRKVVQHFQLLPPDEFRPAPTYHSAQELLTHQRERRDAWDRAFPMNRLLLGITATPQRGDHVGLESVFQRVIYTKSIQDMIREGFLCRIRGVRVTSLTSLDAVAVRGGDLEAGALADAVNVLARNQLTVQAYQAHAKDRRAVVFCVNVSHAHDVAAAFTRAGIRAAAIDGTMPLDRRRGILKSFRERAFDVLTNCQILTEGWDDPGVDCILHARPTKSSLLYIQMTGRGTRVAPGKADCLVVDVVDITRRHSLVSLPTLFGLPVDFDPEGGDVLDLAEEAGEIARRHPDVAGATIKALRLRAEHADLFGIRDPVIAHHAELDWGRVDDHYVIGVPLCGSRTNFLDVAPNLVGGWDVLFHSPPDPTAVLTNARDLGSAFQSAERWYKRRVPKPLIPYYRRERRARLKPSTREQAKAFRAAGLPDPPDGTTHYLAATILAAQPHLEVRA